MVVTLSVRAPSWHDDVRACSLTQFIPYPLNNFRLMLPVSYLCLWYITVLTSYHYLYDEYVCVWLVHTFFISICIHFLEILFCTIFLYLHIFSCPVYFCLHAWFDSSPSFLHVGLNFGLVWPNLNHISNNVLGWGWSNMKGIYVFIPHYHATKFHEQGSF